jgi:hypothetical protein
MGWRAGSGQIKFYWLCLRRPASPFLPVSATNPMVVVDSLRFPYIDGTGKITPGSPPTVDLTQSNDIWSVRRWQPYRGGQAVQIPGGTTLDPRYGYTDQTVSWATGAASTTQGVYDTSSSPGIPATNPVYHTLGSAASPGEPWDYFPFHDRDFTSVAELMLVPGCPPGLFTKQFVESAPSSTFATPTPLPQIVTAGLPLKRTSTAIPWSLAFPTATPAIPRTYPYLVENFFYSAPSPPAGAAASLYGDQTGAGWFKLLEFFEVPSQAEGTIGPQSQGTNFDWARQDLRPGLMNPNLIMDEEPLLALIGQQDASFNQQLLNFTAMPFGGVHAVPLAANQLPRVVTAVDVNGMPLSSYEIGHQGHFYIPNGNNLVKGAFAQFLKARHGGSGFLFGWGNGATGTPYPAYTPAPANNEHLRIASERPFRSLSFPDIDSTVMRPAAMPPSTYSFPVLNAPVPPAPLTGSFAGDPGLLNPYLYSGNATGTVPTTVIPSAIPVRRLFQNPDAYAGTPPSNAGETGDPYVNNVAGSAATSPATGSLGVATNYNVNLVSPVVILPATGNNPYLGNGTAPDGGQHPYYRSEMLQRVMNLTTVRTHQYAVWITVGFFRVTRQGDPSLAFTNPAFAYDQLGAEVGLPGGKRTRYRAFFVVDRTKLVGFDPSAPGNYRDAVVYRQNIQ